MRSISRRESCEDAQTACCGPDVTPNRRPSSTRRRIPTSARTLLPSFTARASPCSWSNCLAHSNGHLTTRRQAPRPVPLDGLDTLTTRPVGALRSHSPCPRSRSAMRCSSEARAGGQGGLGRRARRWTTTHRLQLLEEQLCCVGDVDLDDWWRGKPSVRKGFDAREKVKQRRTGRLVAARAALEALLLEVGDRSQAAAAHRRRREEGQGLGAVERANRREDEHLADVDAVAVADIEDALLEEAGDTVRKHAAARERSK